MAQPLAERIRPQSIDEVVGQKHLIAENAPLCNIIRSGHLPNMIFYGPSGTGKTTVARILAAATKRKLHILNGTNASIADVRAVIGEVNTLAAPNGVLLYLDEIQYFNKKQQQSLLEYIENGTVTLIAATTENPYFYIYPAILSRSTVFEFKFVTPEDILPALERAFAVMAEDFKEEFEIEDGVLMHIARGCGGDVRKGVNSVELTVLSSNIPDVGQKRKILLETAKAVTQKTALRYDHEGDEHYDLLSAFQKSMRGSDPNATLHYLARILEAGDMPSACRRLMVCAAEDVGLAYPMIIPIVKAAVDMAFQVGMPEARIPLADAAVLVATSPKSNSAYLGYDAALSDLQAGKAGPVPRTLQNKHFDGEDAAVKGQFYNYPHAYPNHWCKQQYLPDNLKSATYYQFGENRTEQAAKEYWDKIKK
ncbi:MAG: replication-associated recombination protein A [Clostridia bacterium]|nr:replication-associated recombination protein A [Clostridia bacterium]MBQ6863682.1 replication-associated recombination protein A [Clostridia bacterium]